MSQGITPILRQIGRTDALMQGHALSAQLVGIALISMLPGFGRQGVIISFFLMTLICGLLELPTGYFADRFGWRKSLLLGSILTIVSTCCMLAAVSVAIVSSHWIIWLFIAAESAIDAIALSFISGAYQAAYQSLYERRLNEQGIDDAKAPPLFLSSYRYGIFIRFGLPLFVLLLGFYIYTIYPPHANDVVLRFLPVIPMVFVLCLTFIILKRIYCDLREITGETKPLKIHWREMFHIWASTHVPFLLHSYFRFSYLVIVICVAGEIYHLLKDTGIGDAYIWLSGMSFALLMRFAVIFFGRVVYHRITNVTTFNAIAVGSLFVTTFGGIFAVVALHSHISYLSKITILFSYGVITLVLYELVTRLIESKTQKFIPEIYRATWFSGSAVLSQLTFAMVSGLSLLIQIPYFSLGVLLGTISVVGICLLCLVRGKVCVDGLAPISLRTFLIGSGFVFLSIYSIVSAFLQTSEYMRTIGFDYKNALFIQSPIYTAINIKFFSVMGTHILLFGALLVLLIWTSRLISLELETIITSDDEKRTEKQEFPLGIQEFSTLREQLLLHQQRLAEYEHARGMRDTAAKAAHDIRSPLSSMQAAVRLLKGQASHSTIAVEAMNLLQLSSQRLENIADDLLLHHRGKTSSGSQLFSIHEVIDELLGELQATPIANEVIVKKAYNSEALYVYGNKNGISRAIGNVIKNAFEAMQKNPLGQIKKLIVSTSHETIREMDSILIQISDTGPGITADRIPLILQGGHTEGKSDGHGLGTKVVRDVVEAHNGHMCIESTPGMGTVFTIAFPIPHLIAENMTHLTVAIPYEGFGAIRVIDDEPSLREQWRITLKGLGVMAESHPSWEEAEPVLPAELQTTFIVDYHFDNSEIDGLEIMRRLKEKGYTNLVLATAEYWKPAIRETASQLDVVLCPKPLPRVVIAKVPDSSVAALPQNDKSGTSILLIDDDADIQTSWRLMKSMLGVGRLAMYSKMEDMIAAATDPAEFDVCVIDKNIEKSQYNGAKMLEYLKQKGARAVVVATGESRDAIANDPEFAGIDGILTSKVPTSLRELLNRKELS